ncbi:MAG: uroporphyrinogen-III synthase [Bacteroidales bacterium]|jgi:uroporphyrinogen-III synthase|nr:uroporphyrinogen-III synthase [Bacteroidales bacterium]NLK82399.1 uroporphyrinogen-III synthase [Bacteroidales bacterium]
MKIKRILVSQPKPTTEKSPYFELAKKNNIHIDFRPFIHVEEVSERDFRNQKINILEHTAVVFTSRTAIDNFFRICKEVRVTVPDTMKYFCISEATAFYIQKYIVYRKRKIFSANGTFSDVIEIAKRFPNEKFLVPLSDIHKQEIPDKLDAAKLSYTKAILYRTVSSDLSDIKNIDYDALIFFSPSGIASLKQNFPDFKQNNIYIGAFGKTTAKAVENAGFRLDIAAPNPKAPSMTMALEQFIKSVNKK